MSSNWLIIPYKRSSQFVKAELVDVNVQKIDICIQSFGDKLSKDLGRITETWGTNFYER